MESWDCDQLQRLWQGQQAAHAQTVVSWQVPRKAQGSLRARCVRGRGGVSAKGGWRLPPGGGAWVGYLLGQGGAREHTWLVGSWDVWAGGSGRCVCDARRSFLALCRLFFVN